MNKILFGVALSMPALVVFIMLLSSADLVFKLKIDSMIGQINFGPIVYHLLFIFIASAIFFGFFVDKAVTQIKDSNLAKEEILKYDRSWDEIVLAAFFFMLNFLFVSFVYIQFAYLFKGVDQITSSNEILNFSQYARKGFFELIFVCAMNAVLITLSCNLVKNGPLQVFYLIEAISVNAEYMTLSSYI